MEVCFQVGFLDDASRTCDLASQGATPLWGGRLESGAEGNCNSRWHHCNDSVLMQLFQALHQKLKETGPAEGNEGSRASQEQPPDSS